MAKLTKTEAALHRQACEFLTKEHLTREEAEFILEHWQESATAASVLDGAFFTPLPLARDLSIEVHGNRVIDLCAGIGRLAWECRALWAEPQRELVCVERNPLYVEVGRKVLPQATWIQADIFDLPEDLGTFDCVIANPPFGATPRTGAGPRYRGSRFEYHVIDVAADLARYGVFIVPAPSAPFRLSGVPHYREERGPEYERFEAETGIRLQANCGIDTSHADGQWHGVSPRVEIVTVDFDERVTPARATSTGPRSVASAAGTQQLGLFAAV